MILQLVLKKNLCQEKDYALWFGEVQRSAMRLHLVIARSKMGLIGEEFF